MSSLRIVGDRIREARQQRRLTLDALAQACDLHKSMLSKIENGRQIPSLPTLAVLSRYLGIGLDALVRGAEGTQDQAWQLTQAKDREVTARDDAVGFRYETLFTRNFIGGIVEACDLYLAPGAVRRTVQTEGRQALFLLEGSIAFELNQEVLQINVGDFLEFDGRLAHVPRNHGTVAARAIVFYLLPHKN